MKKLFPITTIWLILLQLSLTNSQSSAQSFTANLQVIYDNPNHCEGFGVYLLAMPYDNILYSYTWTCPGGISPNMWAPVGGSASFFPSVSQPVNEQYSVLITEIATGDTASATIDVNTNPAPYAGYSVPSTSGCEGQQIYIHAGGGNSAFGPYTYQWGYPFGIPGTSDSTSFTFGGSISFAPDVQITNGFGCSAQNQQIFWLYGSPIPVVNVTAMGPTSFCAGGNVVLDVEASSVYNLPPVSYHWKKSNYFLNNYDTSLTVLSTGRYRCVATAAGCSSTSNYIDVVALPRPSVAITPTGIIGICFNQTAILSAIAPTAVSYDWKKNSATLPNSNNDSITVNKAGKYKVTVTDANGCSRTSSQVEIIGPPNNKVTASGPLSFCAGDSVVLTAAPGFFYQWKKNNVVIPNANGISYTVTTAGNYKVMVMNAFGCVAASPVKTISISCRIAGELEEISQMKLYPNPFNSELTVLLPDEINEGIEIRMFDFSGRLVYRSEAGSLKERELKISPTELKSGTYLIEVISNGAIYKEVIVKQ